MISRQQSNYVLFVLIPLSRMLWNDGTLHHGDLFTVSVTYVRMLERIWCFSDFMWATLRPISSGAFFVAFPYFATNDLPTRNQDGTGETVVFAYWPLLKGMRNMAAQFGRITAGCLHSPNWRAKELVNREVVIEQHGEWCKTDIYAGAIQRRPFSWRCSLRSRVLSASRRFLTCCRRRTHRPQYESLRHPFDLGTT